MKDNIIKENKQYKDIGLREFDYKLFEEEEGGGVREGLDGYPYFKDLIQFWPGDLVNQMGKSSEVVGMKNHLDMSGGKKRLVRPFIRQ